jgi:hypothetical protein
MAEGGWRNADNGVMKHRCPGGVLRPTAVANSTGLKYVRAFLTRSRCADAPDAHPGTLPRSLNVVRTRFTIFRSRVLRAPASATVTRLATSSDT